MGMPQETCPDCGPPEIWLSGETGGWQPFAQPLSALNLEERSESFALVFAKANIICQCKTCRTELATRFSVPNFWFNTYCKKSNGYFGSQDIVAENNSSPGLMTWARFLIKQLQEKEGYKWIKINMLTQFSSPSNQIMLVFDAFDTTKALLRESLIDGPRKEELADPFWIYYRILNDVIVLHDESIWGLRNHVRTIEKSSPDNTADTPAYRQLHDLARHAIHIVETTSVTINTMKRISAAHKDYMDNKAEEPAKSIRKHIQDRLLYYNQVTLGLENRAVALNDRLRNEIQLSFNIVTHEDAAATIRISSLAQKDSTIMKMIAYVTMIFLPATLVSAVFSTSFFNFNPDLDSWRISSQFWIYWVWSLSVTAIALFVSNRLGLPLPWVKSKDGA